MGATSAIEWTEATWSPLVGCTKVSPGCDFCYAETQVNTRFHPAALAKGGRHLEAFPTPFETVSIRPDRFLTLPLHWRKPKRIFVNSLSDPFHKDVPDEFIARMLAVMALAPQHTFQMLTKRPGRMRSFLRDECRCGGGHAPGVHLRSAMSWAVSKANPNRIPGVPDDAEHQVYFKRAWPLRNLWQGVSVESADQLFRVDALRDTPAAVRFISAEPLLGPLDGLDLTGINWVICGGESGLGARPMHPDWARSLRDECLAAGVPFLFKQHGNWAPVQGEDDWRNCRETDHHVRADGYHWPLSEPHGAEDGTEVLMRNVGKKAAGRILDSREWSEYPVVSS